MAKKPFYITTAIDYANGAPHIGHAVEKVGADVMARYHRLTGKTVHFVIGMDEHGQKVLQSAEKAGVTPQAWVDAVAEEFLDLWEILDISYDDFIRTSQPRHHKAVKEMVRRMMENGDLYQDKYKGFYCVGCEGYKTEDELIPGPPGEPTETLRCPIHPSRPVEWMEEDNWFFKLTKYKRELHEYINDFPNFVMPNPRRNEVRKMLESGFQDISVSRAHLPWGVEWPNDPSHTVYVWLDALTNYLSAVGFPDNKYLRIWPADIHVVGKDITRFHCVYWPAFLLSAGLMPPRQVWAHGFVTYGGRKLSKSEGEVLSLQDFMERHGSEALRYYLMREVPWDGDGGITAERFDALYTAELANDLGNLANRAIAMIERYREGVIPDAEVVFKWEDRIQEVHDDHANFMDRSLLHKGLDIAMKLVGEGNGYVEERAPWAQSKDPAQAGDLDETLATLARLLGVTSTLLYPFMPKKMEELAHRLGLEGVSPMGDCLTVPMAGLKVHRGDPLFPRADLA